MKQTILAVTTLALLATALPATDAQAQPGNPAAAGFLGGLFAGLLLNGPPPPAPPHMAIERRPGPPYPGWHQGPSHRRHWRDDRRDDWRDDDRPPPGYWQD